VAVTLQELEAYLDQDGAVPGAWPELDMLAPARGYPARYGAILLPFRAAVDALNASATAPLSGVRR